ncbi:MAG TPA: Mur ligase family protein [Candidatus Dormibacteraeota bacterium]|jgi:dihydrofolate synthase/folylpolyglutamate synthase|nr:Mur ligase family protein [Candidatus Dormibacteraeota bacterium]
MDYAEALAYISATGRFGIKLGLERTRALLAEVGDPHAGMRGALVAGTNGKGSVCACLTSILVAAGYRVGGMPKPHLSSYTERVCVDGRPIGEAEFAAAVTAIVPAVDRVTAVLGPPTEFEMLTAAALLELRRQQVDLLVCEVGMGGRLDSTNVLDLGVKVITTIALDHRQWLGDTIAAIAGEKAGIVHAGDLVVTGLLPDDAAAVVAARAAAVGAAGLWRVAGGAADAEVTYTARDLGWAGCELDVVTPARLHPGLRTSLLGRHQAGNAAVAVAAADALVGRHGMAPPRRSVAISVEAVAEGLAAARWPGRLELVQVDGCDALLDGGHNPAAVATVAAEVERLLAGRPAVVVFAAMSDKDFPAMLACLPGAWPAILTAVEEPRAAAPADLLDAARALGRAGDVAVPGVAAALEAATRRARQTGGLVLVIGSLYLAGAARAMVPPG